METQSKTDPVNWGVLTTTRIARKKLIPAMQSAAGTELRAISSGSGRAAPVAGQFSIPAAYDSHEELLAAPGIDAVYLPFPNSLHAQWARAAAAAGKHVLCEKPIVESLEEYRGLAATFGKANLVLLEAFMYRFHPQYAHINRLITAGRIGALASMHARFHFTMDRSRHDIRLDPQLDGGALNDVGCYGIDVMNMIAGRAPETGYALGATRSDRVESSAAGILDYAGVLGSFDCGFEGPDTNTVQIIGTDGSLTVDGAFIAGPHSPSTLTWRSRTGGTEQWTFPDDAYRHQIEYMNEAIRAGKGGAPFSDLTEWNIATRQALHRSMRSRRAESVTL